ncbi:MAG: sensor histidine kinase [Betaproteobacteria bacterium]
MPLPFAAEFLWRRQNLTFSLMLAALHLALALGLQGGALKAFVLMHFGLFLLWQPMWQGGRDLVPGHAAVLVAAGVALAWWSNGWLLALWIAVLFALIGSHLPVMRDGRQRAASLLAALYLLALLFAWVVPKLLEDAQSYPPFALDLIRYGLIVPVAIIAWLPAEARSGPVRQGIDLVYSLLLFLLVVVLVLGALFVQRLAGGGYVAALTATVLGVAAMLLLLAWLWDPRGGFEGVGQLLSRYFLSLGLPFEQWMHRLASLAEGEADPERFLSSASREMLGLPWLSGVSWQCERGSGAAGVTKGAVTRLSAGGLILEMHTRVRPSPALLMHMRLLAQLLGHYYAAKVREQAERSSAYLQAVYETGARLTHDVKNLLQSLRSLCSAAQSAGDRDDEALRRLIQRQLPLIAQRLQVTLDKIEARPASGEERDVPAVEWWRALGQRHAHERVDLRARTLPASAHVPADLFDRVVENLLHNAREKRQRREASAVTVELACEGNACRLTVSDDGEAVPQSLAKRLFEAPVPSASGLGVGLYQSARYAAERGYALKLERNVCGDVRFVLAPAGSDAG